MFPTSDEDSSTPDDHTQNRPNRLTIGFRPLTRIHLLLTSATVDGIATIKVFPTSDEDSSTPDQNNTKRNQQCNLFVSDL